MQGSIQNLNDKVFKIVDSTTNNDGFSFVHLKLKEFQFEEENEKRTLIQIIDMSDKIFYNEAKAE